MKIALYTPEFEVIEIFNKLQLTNKHEIFTVKVEKIFFDCIQNDSFEGFALHHPNSFSKKAIDFIKRKNSYTPVLLFGNLIQEQGNELLNVTGADMYLPFSCSEDLNKSYILLHNLIIENLKIYINHFGKLRKLTTHNTEIIEFGPCKYDPSRRTLYHNNIEIKKLSSKEGGILEILGSNYGQVIKREIIMEKVWQKSDYFSGRSMDVYVTHLRRLFEKNGIKLEIKNISGIGLTLE